MANGDLWVANDSLTVARLNLKTLFVGTTEPAVMVGGMEWFDSANNIKYTRNKDNNAWIIKEDQSVDSGATPTFVDALISGGRLGASTYKNLSDTFMLGSSGKISGGEVTDAGSGGIAIAAMKGCIRTSNSSVGALKYFDIAGATILSAALTDNSLNFIYCDYNAGTPIFAATASLANINQNTQFSIAVVWKAGNEIETVNSINQLSNFRNNENRRLLYRGIEYMNGAAISETGNRNLITTDGIFYYGTNKISSVGVNTSGAGRFASFYRAASPNTWTEVTNQQVVDNGYYDDGTGTLHALTANRYTLFWAYMCMEGDLYLVYGRGDYTLAQAQAAALPPTLPPYITNFAKLIGKIIVQAGATHLYSIESALNSQFSLTQATTHNNLAGLEGGVSGVYNHLGATLYGDLTHANAQIAALQTTGGPTFETLTLTKRSLQIGTAQAITSSSYIGWYHVGSPASGNPFFIFQKCENASTDVLQLYGYDGTTVKIFLNINYGDSIFSIVQDLGIDDGKSIKWSDVNLYRSAANVLKTDDALTVVGQLLLPTTGVSAGVLIGGDVLLYRSAAHELCLDDLDKPIGDWWTVGNLIPNSGPESADDWGYSGGVNGYTTTQKLYGAGSIYVTINQANAWDSYIFTPTFRGLLFFEANLYYTGSIYIRSTVASTFGVEVTGSYGMFGANFSVPAAIARPDAPTGTVVAGGALPLDTYRICVSATNAIGETLASEYLEKLVDTAGTQQIDLTWTAVTGATGYVVHAGRLSIGGAEYSNPKFYGRRQVAVGTITTNSYSWTTWVNYGFPNAASTAEWMRCVVSGKGPTTYLPSGNGEAIYVYPAGAYNGTYYVSSAKFEVGRRATAYSNSIIGHLKPCLDNAFNLGSAAYSYKNLYIGTGKIYLGTAEDVNLYRGEASILYTDGGLKVVGNYGIYLSADRKLYFGDGSSAYDVNLYRSTDNALKTDDDFIANNLTTVGTVQGALVKVSTSSLATYLDLFQSNIQEWKVGMLTATNSLFTIEATGASPADVFTLTTAGALTIKAGLTVGGAIICKVNTASCGTTALYSDNSAAGTIGLLTSSKRFKENIKVVDDASWIFNLNPVTFTWKDEKRQSEGVQIGLIAEDVYEQYPSLAFTDTEGLPLGIHYERICVPMLIELKKLRVELDALKLIKGKDGMIDHSTLPKFAQYKQVREYSKMDNDGNKIISSSIETDERDLGAMISMLTVAVQQLTTKVEFLESKIK